MSDSDQKIKKLHEMVFIYNAVMDGWSVRKLRDGQIRLKKKTKNNDEYSRNYHSSDIQQYDLDLIDFINENTQIDRIFN
jgi:hypothetical protein